MYGKVKEVQRSMYALNQSDEPFVYVGSGIERVFLHEGPLHEVDYLCTSTEQKNIAGKILYLPSGTGEGRFSMYQVGKYGNAAAFIGWYDPKNEADVLKRVNQR